MVRDLSNISRNLEDTKLNDIIYKKNKIKEMFESDPDLNEVLNRKEKRPLNKFNNPDHPTDEELKKRKEIEAYNAQVGQSQIIKFLKLNGINKEVLNFVMFDIRDNDISYENEIIKNQQLIVLCLVHEDDIDTEYNVERQDLLAYIIKDLLCWSNALGMQLKCICDTDDIIDSRYYCRTLKFLINAPNVINGHGGMVNKYDRFRKI